MRLKKGDHVVITSVPVEQVQLKAAGYVEQAEKASASRPANKADEKSK